jgi:murein L,D-transpeptidase YcbB/YkuD
MRKLYTECLLGLVILLGPLAPAVAQVLDPAAGAASDIESPANPVESGSIEEQAAPNQAPAAVAPGVQSEQGAALQRAMSALAAEASDEDRNERAAIAAFYAARGNEPLFVAETGLGAQAVAAVAEFANADAWGLDPRDFVLPPLPAAKDGASPLSLDQRAEAEIAFARMVQLYARYARGGRIIHPAGQLNSNLDRRPQFAKPADVMSGFAAASDAAAYLRGLNPQHAQFEKLRQRYLVSKGNPRPAQKLGKGSDLTPGASDDQVPALRQRLGLTTQGDPRLYDDLLKAAVVFFQTDRQLSRSDGTVDAATRAALDRPEPVDARRLLANMEEWRWMPANLGDLHLMANVPDFMINLYKDGAVVFTERIVAGEIGKQTTIYSRPLRHIVLRPAWRVPESIKVKELWPSLRRGGGLMSQYGLQLETKDGKALNWRSIDWFKDDIRNYEVTQPPGPRSVLGHVKFSFPSPHTIFMHDTPDKWMFNSAQRTLSHGCLRLRNPMKLVEILLKEDKGWDRTKIDELSASGPLNNEVPMEKRIMMHLTYFTAWVGDDGKLKVFADIYGHEKRISQALEGKWDKIAKGRDHLAAPEPNFSGKPTRAARTKSKDQTAGDVIGSALGGLF